MDTVWGQETTPYFNGSISSLHFIYKMALNMDIFTQILSMGKWEVNKHKTGSE